MGSAHTRTFVWVCSTYVRRSAECSSEGNATKSLAREYQKLQHAYYWHKEAHFSRNMADYQQALFDAATNGDWALIELALQEGAALGALNDSGSSVLHLAIQREHWKVAFCLLDMPDSHILLEVRDENGFTPLLLACYNGNGDVIQRLVSVGANTLAQTSYEGVSALHIAWRRRDIATYLVSLPKFDPDLRDHEGQTALHRACRGHANGSVDDVAFLLDHGFNIHARDQFLGNTPLHSAVDRLRWAPHLLDIIRLLLERGSRANDKNSKARSALHELVASWGTHSNDQDIARELVRFGAGKLSDADCKGMTPFDIAYYNGKTDLVQELISVGYFLDLFAR